MEENKQEIQQEQVTKKGAYASTMDAMASVTDKSFAKGFSSKLGNWTCGLMLAGVAYVGKKAIDKLFDKDDD